MEKIKESLVACRKCQYIDDEVSMPYGETWGCKNKLSLINVFDAYDGVWLKTSMEMENKDYPNRNGRCPLFKEWV